MRVYRIRKQDYPSVTTVYKSFISQNRRDGGRLGTEEATT